MYNILIRYCKRIRKFLTVPCDRFYYLNRLGYYDNLTDREFLKKAFKVYMGKELDLDNPKTFNEKLQWLKLYDRNPMYTKMVDKYQVKEYVSNIIGDEYLIKTLGVWDRFEEIDFDKLPDRFVLKCTHDSHSTIICKDKNKFDLLNAKKLLSKALKKDFFLLGREWPYKNVPHKIIAEEYMEDAENKELRDYKFYCFNGKVVIMVVNSDRETDAITKGDYFDRDYNYVDMQWGFVHAENLPKKPDNFNEMVELAEKLSAGIPEVRVDLYNCNGKIYFGEYTFFDGCGFEPIKPEEWDYKLGSYIKLSK